jgi:hypothetical protein
MNLQKDVLTSIFQTANYTNLKKDL